MTSVARRVEKATQREQMKKLLSKVAFIVALTSLTQGCGASQKETLTTALVTSASALLDRVEAYADEQLLVDRQRAILRGDLRAEREALVFWGAIYDLLLRAQDYLLVVATYGDLDNQQAQKAAFRCYQEILVDISDNVEARGLSIAPLLSAARMVLPKGEKQCR